MRCFKMTFLFLFWFVGVLSVVCEPENQLLVITMNVFTMQYVHFLNTNCIFTANSNNNWVIRVLIHGIIGGPRLEPGFESRRSPRFRPRRKTPFSILVILYYYWACNQWRIVNIHIALVMQFSSRTNQNLMLQRDQTLILTKSIYWQINILAKWIYSWKNNILLFRPFHNCWVN